MDVLACGEARLVDLGQVTVVRRRQVEPFLPREGAAVLDVAGKALLTEVEVERADLVAHAGKRGCDMHAGRGLARPALFVAHDDDMRHVSSPSVVPVCPESKGALLPARPYYMLCALPCKAR